MIQDSQMNRVYLSDLLPEKACQTNQNLKAILDEWKVVTHYLKNTKDIWCRDYMPMQVSKERFQNFYYHPDYLCGNGDLETYNWYAIKDLGITVDTTINSIIIDGGNVVRCGNKVVMTAKVLEENPQYRPFDLIDKLEKAINAEIIFLPWDTNEIFGHADGICRYVDDDTILMTNYRQFDKSMAVRFRKCLKPHFKNVVELNFKSKPQNPDGWAYINWLQTDKVLVVPALNCDSDQEALEQIEAVMPSYKGRIVSCYCPDVIKNGGGLNCCTWTTME